MISLKNMTFVDVDTHKNGVRYPYHFRFVIDWYIKDNMITVIHISRFDDEDIDMYESIGIDCIKKTSFPKDKIVEIREN